MSAAQIIIKPTSHSMRVVYSAVSQCLVARSEADEEKRPYCADPLLHHFTLIERAPLMSARQRAVGVPA